jgi:hypothetical protein
MLAPRWPSYAFSSRARAQTTLITDLDIETFITCVDKASQAPLEPKGEDRGDIQAHAHEILCPGKRSVNDVKALAQTLFRRAQLHR